MRTLLISCLAAALFNLVACEGGPARLDDHTAAGAPVWPAPPASPRVRWLKSFGGPRDLGIARPALERVLDGLLGRPEQRFVRPAGVAALDDVVYVADPGLPALWILDTARARFVQVTQAAGAALATPVAVAVRADGAVFVADSTRRQVFLFDRQGRYLATAAGSGLERPAALAWAEGTGLLYVADSARHRILAFDAKGVEVRRWGEGGDGQGQFNFPSYLAQDGHGSLLVTDALNFRVQAFSGEGRFQWSFGRNGDGGGDFAAPKGLASDSAGHVFVADALFDTVQVFERDGTFLLSIGERGAGPGQFSLPTGLFIDSRDRIWVADGYNARVQVFASVGQDPGREAK